MSKEKPAGCGAAKVALDERLQLFLYAAGTAFAHDFRKFRGFARILCTLAILWHTLCYRIQHMKTMIMAETNKTQDTNMRGQTTIYMPIGLLGFEHVKRYVLLSHPDEAPFLWLQMLDDPSLAFLCVSPLHVSPEYQPDISPADVESLQLTKPDDALIVSIVTLHPSGQPTVNLKGPVIINRHTLIGKQVVPSNAADYASQHPLPVAS